MEEIIKLEEQVCSFCQKPIQSAAIYCNNCGHPENGTDQERARFFGKRAMQKNRNVGSKDKIKSARNTLFVLSGLMILLGLIMYFVANDIFSLAIQFGVALIYLALAFWSEKNPFIALLLGLLLYITLIAVSALVDPSTLIKGFIWKILIISYLGKGLYSALEMKKEQSI